MDDFKPRRVTDFSESTIEVSYDVFRRLPLRVQNLITTYNENPDAFVGRTVKLVVGTARVAEIMSAVDALAQEPPKQSRGMGR